MSRQLKLRYAAPEESAQIVEWLNANSTNAYDPEILKYPTLRVLCAYNGAPVSYLPSQQALVLESVAPRPDIDEETAALALRDLVKGMEVVASGLGIRELLFLVSDSKVANIALRNGFDEVPFRVLRMKLQ